MLLSWDIMRITCKQYQIQVELLPSLMHLQNARLSIQEWWHEATHEGHEQLAQSSWLTFCMLNC
jgi:hypothetical protein